MLDVGADWAYRMAPTIVIRDGRRHRMVPYPDAERLARDTLQLTKTSISDPK